MLLLSLGASALWSVLQFTDLSTRPAPIGEQQVALNPTQSDRAWLDLLYQLTGIFLDLVPVALVCWLLWHTRRPHLTALGIDGARPWRDTASGTALVLVIGVPGLALYFAGRALGLTVDVVPSPLDAHWFTVPVLLLSALRAGLTEEVIVVGYLFERFRFPITPLVLGVILGPLAESSFMTTMISYGNDWTVFFTRPISGPIMLVAILTLLYPVFRQMRHEAKMRGRERMQR